MALHQSAATISDNTVSGNTAGTYGGGLSLGQSPAVISGNVVYSNTAGLTGGGLRLHQSDAVLTGNTVYSNTSGEIGDGLYLEECDPTFISNTISANTANNSGGGLQLDRSAAQLTGNKVVRNRAAEQGGGLALQQSDATLINNLVADNRIIRMTEPYYGSGIFIGASSPQLLHTTIARNSGGEGSGLHVTGCDGGDPCSTVTLTNTVVESHAQGVVIHTGNTAILNGVLWFHNDGKTGGRVNHIVTVTNAIDGDPAFVDPDGGDYHIGAGSAARDRGLDAGVVTDLDGNPRPVGAGYDLGAYEFQPKWRYLHLPTIMRQ